MMTFQIACIVILVVCVMEVEQKEYNDPFSKEVYRNSRLLLNDPSLFDRRLEQLESQVQSLTSKLHLAETTITQLSQSSRGQTTYVRWGTHGCKANATLVYSGQVAGSDYSQTGNGANPLCMVHEVLWGASQPKPNMGEIRGAEYQDDFWGPGTLDKDVPCAVCSPLQGSNVLMIPGRNRCLSGWTEQYHGYLSASMVGHPQTTTYVCVDENVESMDAGATNDEHSFLMYGVRGHCGSLKCPPYVEGKPITCVVCSM